MNELQIRPCDGSDRDLQLIVDVINSVSDASLSLARLKEIDSWRPEGEYCQRFIILESGECIGSALHFTYPELEADMGHCVHFDLIPNRQGKGLEKAAIAFLIEHAQCRGAGTVLTGARDSQTEKLAAIESFGFERSRSYVTSELDLNLFDPEVCEIKTKSVQSQGIEILSAAQLKDRGIDWLDLQYGFQNNPELPHEAFRKKSLESPGYFPESQFAAYQGKQFCGITSLRHVKEVPGRADNDLTKVVFEMKRKGIATALKCASLLAARQQGIAKVRTCNESTNPMLVLNQQLGFETVIEDIELVKRLDS